jgi:hypothetical protein
MPKNEQDISVSFNYPQWGFVQGRLQTLYSKNCKNTHKTKATADSTMKMNTTKHIYERKSKVTTYITYLLLGFSTDKHKT